MNGRIGLGAVFGVFAVTAALGMACGSSKTDSPGPQDTPVTLATNATVFDATKADDITVKPDQLVFPAATHPEIGTKKAGDVLVGDRGTSPTSGNPDGFLRTVVSVTKTGSDYVVATDRAYLTDVVTEGSMSGTLTIVDDPTATGKTLHTKGKTTLVDFSGTKLFESSGSVDVAPGKSLGYTAHATLTKGTLDFSPKFDVGATIKPSLTDLKGSLKEAHLIATGTLTATAEIDTGLKLTSSATGDDVAALIAKKVFSSPSSTLVDKKISLGSLKLGFISVPASARFTTVVSCDLRWGGEVDVVAGAVATASVTAGFKYDGSSISPVWSHTQDLKFTGPAWTMTGDVYLRCQIVPKFEVNLFGVAAGELWATAYAALAGKATCDATKLTGDVAGEAYAGVSATAHAKVDVFGLYKWEKTCTLFDLNSPHAKVSGSFPLGKGATCTTIPDPFTSTPFDDPPASCFGGTTPPPADAGPDDSGGDADDSGDGGGDAGLCDHDSCTIGTPLGPTCTKDGQGGACIKSICDNDSYCCEFSWTASCIAHVENGDFACVKKTCP